MAINFRFGIVFGPKFKKWPYSGTTFALSQLIFKRRLARLFKSKCSDRGAFRFEKFIRIGNVVQPNILEHLIRPNYHHLNCSFSDGIPGKHTLHNGSSEHQAKNNREA